MTDDRNAATPTEQEHWDEDNSSLFLDLGKIFTPRREEIKQVFIDLMPADKDEAFVAVELGIGQGWLSEAILQNFPLARVVGLDGSETMLNHARNRLAPFAGRIEFCPFRLEDKGWLLDLPDNIRCFFSCLVIHHLGGEEKSELFQSLFKRLQIGGGLLIADLVAPSSDAGRRQMAAAWDREVRRQSLELTGDLRAYEQFLQEEWNYYNYPDDPVDKPSTALEQLQWLHQAGFVGADVFWALAGHVLFGGFKLLK